METTESLNNKTVSRDACVFINRQIAFAESQTGVRQFTIVGYSGGIIKNHFYWGNLAFDLKGLTFAKSVTPVLGEHFHTSRLGFTTAVCYRMYLRPFLMAYWPDLFEKRRRFVNAKAQENQGLFSIGFSKDLQRPNYNPKRKTQDNCGGNMLKKKTNFSVNPCQVQRGSNGMNFENETASDIMNQNSVLSNIITGRYNGSFGGVPPIAVRREEGSASFAAWWIRLCPSRNL